MHISSLRVYNFRNLQDQTITFSPGANFIIGMNGQGKTNIVEAINLLSIGRSFRTANLDELIRWKEKACSVFAQVVTTSGSIELGIALENEARKAFVDGQPAEFLGEFLGRLLCITFSPTDLALVKGSPQERRKFVDKHMVDLEPPLMSCLVDYHKALRNKNALLKKGVQDGRQLDAWNEMLAKSALAIHHGRSAFLSEVESRAQRLYAEFSQADGVLSLRLRSSFFSAESEATVETILERYRAVRERELLLRSSVVGPHRDEILIELGGNPARAFASQGQARSIVLALKLAILGLIEDKREEAPIILLDDVESELDESRRAALVRLIYERKCQTFITGTEDPQTTNLPATESLRLRIDSGHIESQKLS